MPTIFHLLILRIFFSNPYKQIEIKFLDNKKGGIICAQQEIIHITSKKRKIGLFVGTFRVVAIIGILSKVIKVNISLNLMTFIGNYWLIIIPIILFIILIISYKISEKIYLKKEF